MPWEREWGDLLRIGQGDLDSVWAGQHGLFLVVHDEDSSRQSNPTEAEIIDRILSLNAQLPEGGVAVLTPHRAQRSLLRARLQPAHESVGVVDTVERLQGAERSVVIVSGTASDAASISASAEFLLDLNRANVAFSRARDRLIVVCAKSLLDHIPSDTQHYESAMLWKALRGLCSEYLCSLEVAGHRATVLTPPPRALEELVD